MTASTRSADADTLPVESASGGAILVRGVHKAYRTSAHTVEALRGIDLSIQEPGFYAIMGASGSGKSTLLHLLAGLDRPDTGTVEVAGAAVHIMSERDLTLYRRRRIGIIFQQFNLIPTLTALDNVTLPGVLDGQPAKALEERGNALLELLGLSDRADHRPDALSGGEQQRVAIARALLFEPRVLLADEPTGNLDSATSDRLWALLNRLAAERNITVLMVTHEPAAAVHCRRVYVMRDGLIAGNFDTEGMDATLLATRAANLGRLAG
jgi:putative ABC transport system ATP-binding protein